MKPLRQQAYEVGVELEISRRARSRKYYILSRRFQRLVNAIVAQSKNRLEADSDFDWLWDNLRRRFPDLPWDKPENMRGE